MNENTIFKSIGIMYRTYYNFIEAKGNLNGLSFAECVFLSNIGQNEGIRAETIYSELSIDKAGVTRGIKKLFEKDLILIRKSEKDKRAKELFLTEKGKSLYKKINKSNSEILDDLLGEMTTEERSSLSETLYKISESAKRINKQ